MDKKPKPGEPGTKYDEGKLKWSLAHIPEFEELVKLTMFGCGKYLPRNWENGMDWSRAWDALMRHNNKWWIEGENIDPQSGLSHMIHVAWWALALRRYEKTHLELDDRPEYTKRIETIRKELAIKKAIKKEFETGGKIRLDTSTGALTAGAFTALTSSTVEALSPSKQLKVEEKSDKGLSVYLSGHINIDVPATLEWRKEAEKALAMRDDIRCLNPMRGKEPKGEDTSYSIAGRTAKDIILRDYQDVKSADVVLLKLGTYGSELPWIGTFYELAWAWDNKIPVVAFAENEGGKDFPINHPFMEETITHLSTDLNSALEHIITYYAA